MTDETLPLAELLAKAGDSDFLRNVTESVLQLLMEADVEGVIGGDCQEFCVRAVVESQFATKRSPNMTANWVLAAFHSRAAIFQFLLTSRKTRNSSFEAASSLGK